MTQKMPWYEFAKNTYEIDEFDCASIFVLVGDERALVIDTGIGIGDLKGLIEKLTDKPYDVIMTHGHGDHTGGAAVFEKIYMNPKDIELFPLPPAMGMRSGYPEMIAKREHKHYPYTLPEDFCKWEEGKIPEILPLHDGQEFELGNRKVTVYECPGHTPGEMVLIDDKERILFVGDACNNNLLIPSKPGTPMFTSVEKAQKALERIISMSDRYDVVYNGHHDYRGLGAPLGVNVLPKANELMKAILNGTAEIREVPDPMAPGTGRTRKVAVAEDEIVNIEISFDPAGLFEE